MTRWSWRAAILLMAVSPLGPARGAEQKAEAPSAELKAIDATWNALRMKPDVPALQELLVDDWRLTHSDGRVQTKTEYLDELRTRSRANQSIVNEDVTVRFYGDTAIVTGTSVQSGVTNGQPFSGRFRFTRVWVKRDGRFRMVASHSSRIEATR